VLVAKSPLEPARVDMAKPLLTPIVAKTLDMALLMMAKTVDMDLLATLDPPMAQILAMALAKILIATAKILAKTLIATAKILAKTLIATAKILVKTLIQQATILVKVALGVVLPNQSPALLTESRIDGRPEKPAELTAAPPAELATVGANKN